jgi:hypothetical protein
MTTFVVKYPAIFEYENLGISFFYLVKVMADLETNEISCKQIINLCLITKKNGDQRSV